MVIDFHNHFYPPDYIAALQSGSSRVQVTIDDDGNPRLHYPGDYNIAVRGHRDIVYRTSVLEQLGLDTQVISLTTPGTHVEEPQIATKLAPSAISASCTQNQSSVSSDRHDENTDARLGKST